MDGWEGKKNYDDVRFDYAWKWFVFHADQRTKMFNFMLVAVGIFANGVVGALDKRMAPIAAGLCFVAGAVAIIFSRLDLRNQRLVEIGEDVLEGLEKSRIFAKVENTAGGAISNNETADGILWRKRQEDRKVPSSSRLEKLLHDACVGKHRFWLRNVAYLLAALFFISAAGILLLPETVKPRTSSVNDSPGSIQVQIH